MRILLSCLIAAASFAADFEPPSLARLHPLGGRAGTAVEVEILGSQLDTASGVAFDCQDLVWKQTLRREAGRLTGVVWIEPSAPLGPHMLTVRTARGPSTGLIFNVGQFPAVVESDYRTLPSLPAEVYGRLDGGADHDTYWFAVRAGERWLFDMRAMEHGSAVESRMLLLDGQGEKIAFNDDRDQYNENPLIDYTFQKEGVYGVKLDQYRGPRGFTFGKNNGYILRISSLPSVAYVSPLGARRGTKVTFLVSGAALAGVKDVYLTELRRGEYARMTYPYTMPVHYRPDPPHAAAVRRIPGRLGNVTASKLEASFEIPADAPAGMWKLWLVGPAGVLDGPRVVISELPEWSEEAAVKSQPAAESYVVNGRLAGPKERDVYPIRAKAGKPLHLWTLSTQLDGAYLDTVLVLKDAQGKKLAEGDDVVAGWGGLLGNPDSAIFYVPKEDGQLFVEVRDRQNRGGPSYDYRLHVDGRRPSFQLFTTPENVTARAGQETVLKTHLAREAGFDGPVDIWTEGLPEGEQLKAQFRADQVFEPNADGADMIIPEISLRLKAPAKPGVYPFRIFGKSADGVVVEAQTATMIGPIYQGDWNFYRRPVPNLTFTVVE